MTLKILTIVGARPQFIKAAAVSRAITETDGLSEVMVHTGQHFDHNMSQSLFDSLSIPAPRHNLGIHGGGHGQMTGRMLERLEAVMEEEKPDQQSGNGRRRQDLGYSTHPRLLSIDLLIVFVRRQNAANPGGSPVCRRVPPRPSWTA